METAERLYTADEFLALPGEWRWEELIDGRIVVTDPTLRHQLACSRIVGALLRWIDEGGGFGLPSIPVGLRIDDRNVLAPDVLWYPDAAVTEPDAPAQLVPPDLVVEVRSPSTWKRDRGVKRELYEAWGVQELWLVDTRIGTVVVHRRGGRDAPGFDTTLEVGDDELLSSPILPGFELQARAVFVV